MWLVICCTVFFTLIVILLEFFIAAVHYADVSIVFHSYVYSVAVFKTPRAGVVQRFGDAVFIAYGFNYFCKAVGIAGYIEKGAAEPVTIKCQVCACASVGTKDAVGVVKSGGFALGFAFYRCVLFGCLYSADNGLGGLSKFYSPESWEFFFQEGIFGGLLLRLQRRLLRRDGRVAFY